MSLGVRRMAKRERAKGARIVAETVTVLEAHRPQTVKQVFYELVRRKVVKNSLTQFEGFSKALAVACQEGRIPSAWIARAERRAGDVKRWNNLSAFVEVGARAYRRDICLTQPSRLEVWMVDVDEALAGIFEDVLERYGVTLNVGSDWGAIGAAAQRFGDGAAGKILFFGGIDPSGEDVMQSLHKRFGTFQCRPKITRSALVDADVVDHDLAPVVAPVVAAAVAAHRPKLASQNGAARFELSALPAAILHSRIISEVTARMNLDELAVQLMMESFERDHLASTLAAMGEPNWGSED